MHETAFSFSHIEFPVPGMTVPAGRHTLRGWVWPKPGGHFVDVRARVDGRQFPGIHGRPRADLAAHFQTGRRLALAEFWVVIDFLPGPAEVTLEVLEIEGRWTPFETVRYSVGPGSPPPAMSPLRPLLWHDFGRSLDFLLRTRRNRPEAPWVKLATELAAELPVGQDQLGPPDPFIGHADEPALANRNRFGLLPVVGYIFHKTEPIQRLWGTADLQALQPLKLGRATTNLIPHYPDYPVAAASGYEGFVDVPPQLPNPVAVRLYATMPDGSVHLVQVRRTRRHDAEIEKYPYLPLSSDEFTAALTAWESALRVRGFTVTRDEGYHAEVARLRAAATRVPVPARTPPPARVPAVPDRPLRRAILATHNLNLEGAPLFLLDLARHFAANGVALTVVSPSDGALRDRFAACGANIVIVDTGPVFRAGSAAAAETAIEALGRAFDFSGADLVITNTFTAFWAVQAAKAAGQRVLSYVHESTSPAAFYGNSVHPAVLALAEEALALADAVSFTSDATRRYHAGPDRPVKAVLTPGWVDVAAIDAWCAAHHRETLRAGFGVQPGELLVTNVGTVCDRKAQISFARSVDLFNRRYPELAARTRFILLGGRQAYFDDFLRDILAGLDLPNLVVHPETPDFLGYYCAADVSACSSYEESSPRVVLEAMACGTPLLASNIPGISELARDGLEAVLVPPGHTTAWAEALARILSTPDMRREISARARARVESCFASALLLPRHLALATKIAAGQAEGNKPAAG
ncbi:MAG TPA: glycosyltransferase family 4 protein [Lacunisphaera sp.]|nr:glycosyltransferase family 4 protein [Lacunisphaera sp.]